MKLRELLDELTAGGDHTPLDGELVIGDADNMAYYDIEERDKIRYIAKAESAERLKDYLEGDTEYGRYLNYEILEITTLTYHILGYYQTDRKEPAIILLTSDRRFENDDYI